MTGHDEAWARLRSLMEREPPKVPPRKGGNRKGERRRWTDELHCWLRQGLRIEKSPDQVRVVIYGSPLPGASVRRLPDGTLKAENRNFRKNREQPPSDWSPKLPLPHPGASLAAFLRKNDRERDPARQWSLKNAVMAEMERRGLDAYTLEIADDPGHGWFDAAGAAPVLAEWAAAAAALANPEAVDRLSKISGQKVEFNVRNHNLAILSLPALEELAKSNPGALGWWINRRERRNDLEERRLHFARTEHDPLYRNRKPPPFDQDRITPGEVISTVRADFAAAGGKRWKALARQPAGHIARQLKLTGPHHAAWLADLLAETAPHTPEPPLPVKMLIITGVNPLHESFLQAAERAGTRNAAALLLKAATGKKPRELAPPGARPLKAEFEDILDYARNEPQAAARAKTWLGIRKASGRWHRETAQTRRKEDLERMLRETGIRPDERWSAPLEAATLPHGLRATLIQSPAELAEEADKMKHCVGALSYITKCHRGETRIFRLEPASEDNEKARPERTTTLELTKQPDGEWNIGQHRGKLNRPPSDEETGAAAALLAEWRKRQHQNEAPARRRPATPGVRCSSLKSTLIGGNQN